MANVDVVAVLRRIDSGKASPTECAELHICIDAVAELIEREAAQRPSALTEKLRDCESALAAAEKREAALIASDAAKAYQIKALMDERDALAERVKALEESVRRMAAQVAESRKRAGAAI